MLITLNRLMDKAAVSNVRDALVKATWVDGATTAGGLAKAAKNNLQVDEMALIMPVIRKMVLDSLNANALFFSAALPLKVAPPQFNLYRGQGHEYGNHVDSAMRLQVDGSGHYLRADISATLFLSEPDEYEGGALCVQDTFGEHRFKLPAGSLLIYPSSSIHRVEPVTGGERFASFLFVQSMVRCPQRRRLLYDMDMALLHLRESQLTHHELSEPVLTLTGNYHNLLRMWAETS